MLAGLTACLARRPSVALVVGIAVVVFFTPARPRGLERRPAVRAQLVHVLPQTALLAIFILAIFRNVVGAYPADALAAMPLLRQHALSRLTGLFGMFPGMTSSDRGRDRNDQHNR